MIPNNIYYRRIAQILNNTEYEHFYSTLYYMKRIAMSFGETYTGFNPSNKYLKDWAIAREVTDDEKHHINRYWLHQIALTYDNTALAGKTDNYYLKIIYDKLSDEPTPVPTTFKTYINGVEVDNTQELPANIISYADSEYIDYKFVVLDENNDPLSGYNIPLSVGGSAVSPTPVTDSNGEVNYRYESSGVGDTNISINCTLVSKRYDIQDTFKYSPNEISRTSTSTGSYMFTPLFDGFSFVSDSFVAEFDIKVNGNGVGVCISSTSNNNKFLWLANQIQSNISKKVLYYRDSANAEKNEYYNTMDTNTYYHIKMEYSNSELKVYDETGLLSTITGLTHYNGDTRSIYFGEWIRNHTVTVKNVLIKPL